MTNTDDNNNKRVGEVASAEKRRFDNDDDDEAGSDCKRTKVPDDLRVNVANQQTPRPNPIKKTGE